MAQDRLSSTATLGSVAGRLERIQSRLAAVEAERNAPLLREQAWEEKCERDRQVIEAERAAWRSRAETLLSTMADEHVEIIMRVVRGEQHSESEAHLREIAEGLVDVARWDWWPYRLALPPSTVERILAHPGLGLGSHCGQCRLLYPSRPPFDRITRERIADDDRLLIGDCPECGGEIVVNP